MRIRDIALALASLKRTYLPNLRSIIITSNGLLPQRIISNYKRILEGLRDTNIDLVSVASIDGIGETHDTIRETKGTFKLAIETMSDLLKLRQEYPNYFIGLKTTILPENIEALGDILDFALEKNLFHIISPVFFTEKRFRNTDLRDALKLGPTEYEKILNFYRRNEFNTVYFYSRARSSLATGRKQWTCTAAYNYLFIEFDVTVYPCELIPEPIGNIREQNIAGIWNSPRAHYWRKKIGRTGYCHRCLEPGAIRYSAGTEGLSYLSFLVKLGRHRFQETLHGEGFAKYFGY